MAGLLVPEVGVRNPEEEIIHTVGRSGPGRGTSFLMTREGGRGGGPQGGSTRTS
jgi:hypothetical protein